MIGTEVYWFWKAYEDFWQVKGQRKGQAMMNALRVTAPPLYDEASGSLTLDCFYNDSKIPALREWLGI